MEAVRKSDWILAAQDPLSWQKKVMYTADNKRKEAAETGSSVHDALEQYFLTGDIDEERESLIVPAIDLIHQEFDYMWATPEVSFGSRDGYGGKIDLLLDDNILIDFKTKSKDEITDAVLTDDHHMQLAAYRIGLDLPKLKCYNLFISTTKPGSMYLHEWDYKELNRGWKMFKCLLKYWQLSNNFDSSFK